MRETEIRRTRQDSQITKNDPNWPTLELCDKDSPERSDAFSGAICLKTLVLLGNDRKLFGAVRAIFWLCESFFGS